MNYKKRIAVAKKADRTAYHVYGIATVQNRRKSRLWNTAFSMTYNV